MSQSQGGLNQNRRGLSPQMSMSPSMLHNHSSQPIGSNNSAQGMIPLHSSSSSPNMYRNMGTQQWGQSMGNTNRYQQEYRDIDPVTSEKVNLLNSKSKMIARQNPFFNFLEHSVRLAIGSATATALRVFTIKEQSEYVEFNGNVGEEGVIDVWMNLNDVDDMGSANNTLENIAHIGFEIPENGLRVTQGRKQLDPSTHQASTSLHYNGFQARQANSFDDNGDGRSKVYRLLHCLVKTGKSFCVDAENAKGSVSVPAGYDTVYLQPSKLNFD